MKNIERWIIKHERKKERERERCGDSPQTKTMGTLPTTSPFSFSIPIILQGPPILSFDFLIHKFIIFDITSLSLSLPPLQYCFLYFSPNKD